LQQLKIAAMVIDVSGTCKTYLRMYISIAGVTNTRNQRNCESS